MLCETNEERIEVYEFINYNLHGQGHLLALQSSVIILSHQLFTHMLIKWLFFMLLIGGLLLVVFIEFGTPSYYIFVGIHASIGGIFCYFWGRVTEYKSALESAREELVAMASKFESGSGK